MSRLRTLGIVALASAALLACSSEPAPAPASEQQAAKPAPVAPVVADAEPVEEYRYDPTGKPDPFRSFVRLQEDLEDGVSTPLERFEANTW